MSLTVKESGGGSFKQVDAGTYIGVCYRIIDLGTQHDEYQGKATVRQQILVSWEFPTELIEGGEYDGQPYSLSKFYTASLNEKANLRKDLESWRGREFTHDELAGFNLKNILGKACMVSVIKNEDGKSKISGIMALPKGTTAPKHVNPLQQFDLSEFDQAIFDTIPEGIRAIIERSEEYQAITRLKGVFHEDDRPFATGTDDDSAIPF